MADKTTISLPESLKDDLDGLKEHEDEPYWKVVRRLIATHNKQVMDGHNSDGDSVDSSELARELGRDLGQQITDDLVSQLPPKIAEELQQ